MQHEDATAKDAVHVVVRVTYIYFHVQCCVREKGTMVLHTGKCEASRM